MPYLKELRKPSAPPRDRPIIIVEGRAYRLRECRMYGPSLVHSWLFVDLPAVTRYEVDMVTTSDEVVSGEYRHATMSFRPSGRKVYTFSKSRAQKMLESARTIYES